MFCFCKSISNYDFISCMCLLRLFSFTNAKFIMECDKSQHCTRNWKGTSKSMLPRSFGKKLFPSIVPSDQHTILFKTPVGVKCMPEPYPKNYRDGWDYNHVKMPCSSYNLLINRDNNSKKNRWDVIKENLQKPILSSEELEKAILSYNLKYKGKWKFHLLHLFFNECLSEEEMEVFFNNLLPKIIELALRLPTLITNPIPLLKQNHSHSISFSQMQIACLFANAFLCTFPYRNNSNWQSEYSSYSLINFSVLFQSKVTTSNDNYMFEKLKCIICYLKKVTSANSSLSGIVTYSRRHLSDSELPFWLKSTNQLTNLYITSAGTIEDDGDGMLQIDFANKFIGGGVLGHGCVQEEIRFLICPELIVSQLFSQQMLSTEAIVITGVERFSKYSGYSDTFKWNGVHVDVTPVNDDNRRYCTVVAIDAIFYKDPRIQFNPKNLRRELNKAYAGFSWGQGSECSDVSIATGNWGCGAFQGDCHLKSLLQLLSAAQAKRDVAYFTFGDTKLQESINDMHAFLKNQEITVGEICKILIKYNTYLSSHPDAGLFEYIYDAVTNNNAQKCQNDEMPAEPEDSITLERIVPDVPERVRCSSPNIIESTPEKLEDESKTTGDDRTDVKDNVDKQESQEVRFLHVNQFRLRNDKDRTLCIKQQKNSWLQLNDSKRDFQSVIGKPSITGPLSALKRDKEGDDDEQKRVKRKISDYFSPKR